MEPEILDSLPWTYTAGMFRSTRFGVAEAHGLGVVIQTNYLLERGGVEITEDGRFRPVPELFFAALGELAGEILVIQALGDYQGAVRLVAAYGTVNPAMEAALGEDHGDPRRHRSRLPLGRPVVNLGLEGPGGGCRGRIIRSRLRRRRRLAGEGAGW